MLEIKDLCKRYADKQALDHVSLTVGPGETVDVHTDIYISMPPRLYARITGRSYSLRKHRLLVNDEIKQALMAAPLWKYFALRAAGQDPAQGAL